VLFAAAIRRRNPDSVVIRFDDKTYAVRVDPRDSLLRLAERLGQLGGGGTNGALPLAEANHDE
jgi:60 kDa SS-A/Ro ribonucleoprotein